jgi:hypothetical protein
MMVDVDNITTADTVATDRADPHLYFVVIPAGLSHPSLFKGDVVAIRGGKTKPCLVRRKDLTIHKHTYGAAEGGTPVVLIRLLGTDAEVECRSAQPG